MSHAHLQAYLAQILKKSHRELFIASVNTQPQLLPSLVEPLVVWQRECRQYQRCGHRLLHQRLGGAHLCVQPLASRHRRVLKPAGIGQNDALDHRA